MCRLGPLLVCIKTLISAKAHGGALLFETPPQDAKETIEPNPVVGIMQG